MSALLEHKSELPDKGTEVSKLVAWLNTEKALSERHRYPYLQLFLQCIRFWGGDHYRDTAESLLRRWDVRQIRPIGTEDFRLVDNQIPIYCRHLIATAAQNMPRLEAVPADPHDEEDVYAAQLGTGFLKWRHRKDNEIALREQEWLWSLGTGEFVRQSIYDATGGDPMYAEGDILTQVLDPFAYMKDPYSKGWPPRFLIISEARHVDWIKEQYGVTVEQESVADTMLYYNELSMNVMWGGQKRERELLKNAAAVNQFWIPPGKKYPEGWLFIWVGDQLVHSSALQAGQWPFSVGGFNPVAGRLYNMGLIELMLGDQRQLDSLVTLLHEAAAKTVRGDMAVTGPVATDGRSIRQHVYNARTGAKITVLGPGVEAVHMRYGQDWEQAETRRQTLDRNMHQKAGVNQPSLGQTLDKQVRVGELMVSREGDLQISQWHLFRYAQHLIEVGRQEMGLAKAFYILPRKLEGVGTKKELVWFMGADLRDTRDVITVSVPHMSPAMKQQARMEAFGSGLRGPYPGGLTQQFAARSTLRDVGLDEVDEDLATVYGTFEDLQEKVRAVAELNAQAELTMAEMNLAAVQAGILPGAEEGATPPKETQ